LLAESRVQLGWERKLVPNIAAQETELGGVTVKGKVIRNIPSELKGLFIFIVKVYEVVAQTTELVRATLAVRVALTAVSTELPCIIGYPFRIT
jgi:hypothetical protein